MRVERKIFNVISRLKIFKPIYCCEGSEEIKLAMVKLWSLVSIAFLITYNGEAVTKKRVCVIGAGRAGLAAIKLVADKKDNFDVVAFERNSDVGGLWIYRDDRYLDEHGLFAHSGIYKRLTINLPKLVMAYPDYFVFNTDSDTNAVSHEKFLEYMKNYTDHFQLRKYIQFNTMVTKVIPRKSNGDPKKSNWRIEVRDLNTKVENATDCHAVIVCNGRHSKPNIPEIPGLFDNFPGKVLHSRAYRKPEDFTNQTVVVLGAGNSGVDIAADLNDYAKKVYLSRGFDKDPFDGHRPKNVEVVRKVVSAHGSELTLQDNSTISADAFIFCTGYLMDYPFLDKRSGILVGKNHLRPLFRDALNVNHLSMIFVGLPIVTYYGSLYYDQVQWFLGLLQRKSTIPSDGTNGFKRFFKDYVNNILSPKMFSLSEVPLRQKKCM